MRGQGSGITQTFRNFEVVPPSPLNEQMASGKRALVAGWVG